MRDELFKGRKSKPLKCETGTINLDDSQGPGTHWVSYAKKNHHCEYFDSYGDLKPPQEFLDYMLRGGVKVTNIQYNYSNVQKDSKYSCGQLCLRFLSNVRDYLFD